jgi:hypothetical protein
MLVRCYLGACLELRLELPPAPGKVQMTKVVTYRVLLREGDAIDYSLERTYKSLVPLKAAAVRI